jgi:hypothetical protein
MSFPVLENPKCQQLKHFRDYKWIFERWLRLFGGFCGIPYVTHAVDLGVWIKNMWEGTDKGPVATAALGCGGIASQVEHPSII